MSAALGPYRLQQVDSRIDQIQARLKAIQQTLENDLELRAATDRLAAADRKHRDAERAGARRQKSRNSASRSSRPKPAFMEGGSRTQRNYRTCKRISLL
jgi:hypothetical protein